MDFIRINTYQQEVAAHSKQAVTVQNKACSSAGGAEPVPGFWVCPD
jgi:hypothetical protein